MARHLEVYLHRHLVGNLIQTDHGDINYAYLESWIANPAASPLSQSLPLRPEPFTSKECRGFFGGILPEGEKRRIIANNLGISAKNDFAMLGEIGGECAGAVTFLQPGEEMPAAGAQYRPLPDYELARLLRSLPRRPLLAGEGDIRLSLAGAQDKIAVYIEDYITDSVHTEIISLPLGGAISSHILKPAIERMEDVVLNEALCMSLARAVGLPTASAEMRQLEDIDYLLVKRYDRVRNQGQPLKRLHQEDFCQAMGIISENKYQNEGGPSLEQCFQLVRKTSSMPARDILALLDGVIFNFLIGNNDAHGKNFSLLYQGETKKVQLAPFYDLLCTAYYPDLTQKMAMKIGGETMADNIYPRHFDRFSEAAGLSKPGVKRRVLELASAIQKRLPEVTPGGRIASGIASLIRERCKSTIQRFGK